MFKLNIINAPYKKITFEIQIKYEVFYLRMIMIVIIDRFGKNLLTIYLK